MTLITFEWLERKKRENRTNTIMPAFFLSFFPPAFSYSPSFLKKANVCYSHVIILYHIKRTRKLRTGKERIYNGFYEYENSVHNCRMYIFSQPILPSSFLPIQHYLFWASYMRITNNGLAFNQVILIKSLYPKKAFKSTQGHLKHNVQIKIT